MQVVAAVVTMSAAQLFDLATFMAMVRRLGPEAEANPLVALLFALYGFPLVAIAKVAMLAFVTAIGAVLLKGSGTGPVVAAVLAAGIAVGFAGGVSNMAAIGALPLSRTHHTDETSVRFCAIRVQFLPCPRTRSSFAEPASTT